MQKFEAANLEKSQFISNDRIQCFLEKLLVRNSQITHHWFLGCWLQNSAVKKLKLFIFIGIRYIWNWKDTWYTDGLCTGSKRKAGTFSHLTLSFSSSPSRQLPLHFHVFFFYFLPHTETYLVLPHKIRIVALKYFFCKIRYFNAQCYFILPFPQKFSIRTTIFWLFSPSYEELSY